MRCIGRIEPTQSSLIVQVLIRNGVCGRFTRGSDRRFEATKGGLETWAIKSVDAQDLVLRVSVLKQVEALLNTSDIETCRRVENGVVASCRKPGIYKQLLRSSRGLSVGGYGVFKVQATLETRLI